MEKARENNLLALLEKEGQIKVLQEKIISYEKEKKSQIDHAELLCKVFLIYYILFKKNKKQISDQLLKLIKRLEK